MAESNCNSGQLGTISNDYLPSVNVNAYGMQYEDFLRYQTNELDYDQLKEATTEQKCAKYPDTNQNYDDYEAEAYNNAMLLPPTGTSYYTQLPYSLAGGACAPSGLAAFPLQLAVPFQQATTTGGATTFAQPMQSSYLHYGNYYEANGAATQLLPQQATTAAAAPPPPAPTAASPQTGAMAMHHHHHHHPPPHPHHHHFGANGALTTGAPAPGMEMLFEQQQQQQQRKDDEISNILAGVRKTCYSN